MNYLEVKLDVKTQDVDVSSFVSNVINAQNNTSPADNSYVFDSNRLVELGFSYNNSTRGYAIEKKLNIGDILYLAREIDKLDGHILIHGFLQIKIYKDALYFWDTALIYEGMDSFEYCLHHHNIFSLGDFYLVTKLDTIHTDILEFLDCTRRYSEPTLEFITRGLLWDAKEGKIIENICGLDVSEYIQKSDAKNFDQTYFQ
ncbi:MAG: hypothetical protein R3331_02670 [Sulfurospirillaceae bacterium]|nr:hypothetical protein [Sulfurospirillaceae bacterium]